MGTPIALTIAGSDSSGGAGIQADLKTFSALGVYGASVITALTAQNTRGVYAIHEVPADFITAQLDTVFSDFSVDTVKIGMLGNAAAIAAVAAGLERHGARNIVLDPVLAATSGEKLLRDDARGALRDLIAHVSVLTPNLPEAAALLNETLARDESEMLKQAEKLLELGPDAVLIKGGHGNGPDSVDLLVEAAGYTCFSAPRLRTGDGHGTGCSLASAIAAGLAKGLLLGEAVGEAKTYISAALAAADRLGAGAGRRPVHHFFKWW